jgi:hypothetical protein
MDRKYIDDHHIVARYLADQLSDSERDQFEAHYLEHPDIVQELEATARFKAGLSKLHHSGELERLLRPKVWYRQPGYVAAAATLAAMVVAAGYLLQSSPSAQPLLVAQQEALRTWSGQPLATGDIQTVLRTRTNTYDVEIELADSPRSIELRVLPLHPHPPLDRISPVRLAEGTQNVAHIGGLPAAPDGFVTVYLNGARLQPGRYQLLIAGDQGTSAASARSSFLINVRDTPGK